MYIQLDHITITALLDSVIHDELCLRCHSCYHSLTRIPAVAEK